MTEFKCKNPDVLREANTYLKGIKEFLLAEKLRLDNEHDKESSDSIANTRLIVRPITIDGLGLYNNNLCLFDSNDEQMFIPFEQSNDNGEEEAHWRFLFEMLDDSPDDLVELTNLYLELFNGVDNSKLRDTNSIVNKVSH